DRVLQHAALEQGFHYRQADAADKRVSAEGGSMASRNETLRDRFARQHGAQRQPAPQRRRQPHHVRFDAEMLVAKKFARSAHAGLPLIENQQQAAAAAQLPESPEA